MPREKEVTPMPAKVPLLVFAAFIAIIVSILFLIQLVQPELPWNLGEALWVWGEDATVPSILNWALLIIFIVTLLLGLPAILINRWIACLLLAISGIMAGILLYGAIYVLPFWYWI
jgi:hypothetical protein